MKLTTGQKETLLNLAETTIKSHLGITVVPLSIDDQIFQEKHGVFVTLQKNNTLRGCIGSLSADQSIIEGVKSHALHAAFHDTRFSPVVAQELKDIKIEISILTKPQPLQFRDGQDLLHKLQPNIHGVILQQGHHQATFLPQVWEQLPDPQQFLSHLSEKAGLGQNGWLEPGLTVETYTVVKL